MNSFRTINIQVVEESPMNSSDDWREVFPAGEDILVDQIANVNVNLSYVNRWRNPPDTSPAGADNEITSQIPVCYLYIREGLTTKAQIAALYKKKQPVFFDSSESNEYFTKVILTEGQKLWILITGNSLGVGSSCEAIYCTATGFITSNEPEIVV
jgi:hypothetical protein